MINELLIRPLAFSDASIISNFLLIQDKEYIKFFTPFSFDVETISSILSKKNKDGYFGIIWKDRVIGLFLLRGWDDGYQIPSYGVVIDQMYNNRGLGQLTMEFSKAYCRLCACHQIMLKVHPQNKVAQHIYEKNGFVQTGIDSKNNNWIYKINL